jgi:hypothetical protein
MTEAAEFKNDLTGSHALDIPSEVAEALASKRRTTAIVPVDLDADDAA